MQLHASVSFFDTAGSPTRILCASTQLRQLPLTQLRPLFAPVGRRTCISSVLRGPALGCGQEDQAVWVAGAKWRPEVGSEAESRDSLGVLGRDGGGADGDADALLRGNSSSKKASCSLPGISAVPGR